MRDQRSLILPPLGFIFRIADAREFVVLSYMCYSKEVSAITYGIGSISSGLLYKVASDRDDDTLKIVALFFLFVIQMQLVDFILWSSGPKCTSINKLTSNIGSILNHAQPVVLYSLVRYFNKEGYDKHKRLIDGLIIVYIVALIVYSLTSMPISKCSEASIDKHMKWYWNLGTNSGILYTTYIIAFAGLFYYGTKPPYNNTIGIIAVLSYMYTSVMYRKTWVIGSMWCWIAALIPVFLLVKETLITPRREYEGPLVSHV
jgi:hypothetical protein